jgi:hypothetical protein
MLGLNREGVLDSVVNTVPLFIIVVLTALFVAYNPWGWNETGVIALVFGLHAVPILTLAPVTYLVVKIVVESEEGRSDTARRVRSWFALTDDSDRDADDPDGGERRAEPVETDD